MKRLLCGLLSLYVFAAAGFAQAPEGAQTDPLSQFADRLTKERGGNLWIPDVPEAPPGGYLFRFSLPSGNEGEVFLFICSSLDCSEKTETWTVFQETSGKDWKIVRDRLTLPPTAISEKKQKDRIIYSLITPETKNGRRLISFGADAGESARLDVQDRPLTQKEETAVSAQYSSSDAASAKPDFSEAAKEFQKTWTPVEIRVEKVILSTFLKNKEASWRPINTDFGLAEQYRDAGDKDEISKAIADHQEPSPSSQSTPNNQ